MRTIATLTLALLGACASTPSTAPNPQCDTLRAQAAHLAASARPLDAQHAPSAHALREQADAITRAADAIGCPQ
jgi:hypothetical protein